MEDRGDIVLYICILVVIVLTVGKPDLIDALVSRIGIFNNVCP